MYTLIQVYTKKERLSINLSRDRVDYSSNYLGFFCILVYTLVGLKNRIQSGIHSSRRFVVLLSLSHQLYPPSVSTRRIVLGIKDYASSPPNWLYHDEKIKRFQFIFHSLILSLYSKNVTKYTQRDEVCCLLYKSTKKERVVYPLLNIFQNGLPRDLRLTHLA
jgi:hypothetical protein